MTMGYYSKAPLGDGALSELITGDVGNDAVAASYYIARVPLVAYLSVTVHP